MKTIFADVPKTRKSKEQKIQTLTPDTLLTTVFDGILLHFSFNYSRDKRFSSDLNVLVFFALKA